MTRSLLLVGIIAAWSLFNTSVAQLSGHNTKGDFGLQAGTQPPPGWYVVPLYYDYSADKFRDKNGDKFLANVNAGSIDVGAAVVGMLWVTEKKVLGANYSFTIWPAVTNNALEFPATGIDEKVSTGLADLYIQPINLGWNTERADFTAGLGVYVPTGEYDSNGSSNRGLGMWSYEVFGGTTVYFDQAKTWHFATFAAFETHGKKDGTDTRVGDLLTLEGGLGKSFKDGVFSVGIAYYAQWKLSDDDFGLNPSLPAGRDLGRHRVYGFGPEITIPLASKKTLFGFLNLRYLKETGARTALEGDTFLATFTFPIPSVSLQ